MNASGRPNTCKSNVIKELASYESGARVRNAYAICLYQGDTTWKRVTIPHKIVEWHHLAIKDENRVQVSMRVIS